MREKWGKEEVCPYGSPGKLHYHGKIVCFTKCKAISIIKPENGSSGMKGLGGGT